MPDKSEEGVALNIPKADNRYEDGVPLSVRNADEQPSSKSKSGQKANTTKEKD